MDQPPGRSQNMGKREPTLGQAMLGQARPCSGEVVSRNCSGDAPNEALRSTALGVPELVCAFQTQFRCVSLFLRDAQQSQQETVKKIHNLIVALPFCQSRKISNMPAATLLTKALARPHLGCVRRRSNESVSIKIVTFRALVQRNPLLPDFRLACVDGLGAVSFTIHSSCIITKTMSAQTAW